ncbi:MAG TPA: alpha/beta hydrolase-fold protein [Azospirillaceae bacterium]|nr:alpha/beta hydrolase-fold protein [Azospirillaceae bacterium]
MRRLAAMLMAVFLAAGPAAAQEPPPYQIERSAVLGLDSALLKRRYEVYVKLPPGYDLPENAGRRYPVLYLTDGPYTFQVASGVSRLTHSQKSLEEFILVGLSRAVGGDEQASRRRDYTPWRNPAIEGETGGALAYLQHLKAEVLPLVEQRYRIDPKRRTLVGQSYGALFGMWVALTEPELFRGYILTSTSIWFADKALLKLEAEQASRRKDLKADIYLAVGGLERGRVDMVADQAELAKRLKSRKYPGLRLRADTIEGTVHETTFPVGLVHALMWLFPPRAS